MTCPEVIGDYVVNLQTRGHGQGARPGGQQLWILGGARLLEAGGQVSQPT